MSPIVLAALVGLLLGGLRGALLAAMIFWVWTVL